MSRAVVVVLLLALVGCHSKRVKYAGAGAMIAAGIGSIAIAPPKETCMQAEELFDLSGAACAVGQEMRALFLVSGIALIATGLLATAMISRSGSPEEPPHDDLDDKIIDRLSAQASLAARNGDCTTVHALLARIARRDATVVLDDPAIARCLR